MLKLEECQSAKLIVCVCAREQSLAALETLEASEHVIASVYTAIRSKSSGVDNAQWSDMDSLNVTAMSQHAETVFEMLYHLLEIETCEGAYMYQVDVPYMTSFELPDIPEEGIPVSSLDDCEALPEGMDEKTAKALRALVDID